VARWFNAELNLKFSQREVDFVVPRLDADLALCIDPFLLYKSRRVVLNEAHAVLVGMFNEAFAAFRAGNEALAARLIDFPEVPEVRFGYSRTGSRGSGIGSVLQRLVLETLRSSPELVRRGVRHVEELPLYNFGIAEDRISDLTANVLRSYLIDYTQKQSQLWSIPLSSNVPQRHFWDQGNARWADGYFDLPVDPENGSPILLVPRWIVRRLPWINQSDYLRTDFRSFLSSRPRGLAGRVPNKREAVSITRTNLNVVDAYLDRKERTASLAQPDPPPLLLEETDPVCADLLEQLRQLAVGRAHAYDYQKLVLALLNCILEPELVDGEAQVRTVTGVEIRDLVFLNNSDQPFLDYLLHHYGNLLIVFECKNVAAIDQDDVNQLANYLGDAMGFCGFIVCRTAPSERILAKVRATFNKQTPRRVILFLTDDDLERMASIKRAGPQHPVRHIQNNFRTFMQSLE
jgi:hypothetical protein